MCRRGCSRISGGGGGDMRFEMVVRERRERVWCGVRILYHATTSAYTYTGGWVGMGRGRGSLKGVEGEEGICIG